MTAYAAAGPGTGTTGTIGIKGVSGKAVRVVRIEISALANSSASPTSASYTVSVYAGATLSGGTLVTPLPVRGGGPPATATVRTGGSVSGSGYEVHHEHVQQISDSQTLSNLNSNYAFPFNLILAPTDALWVTINASAIFSSVVYFEELRLARSS